MSKAENIANTALFTPLKVGNFEIKQRMAMSAMTRCRADAQSVPTPRMATYYSQRSSAPGTLVITEGTMITERAGGQKYVPGIWSKEQIEGWKKVTDAVHKNNSFIFLQLWAVGRQACYQYLTKELGHDLVSASALRDETDAQAGISRLPNSEEEGTPRPLTVKEIKEYVADFAQAAKNAIEAGFDGVEIHNANGYLLEQFNKLSTNKRTDEYGGSIPNLARFSLEVVDAVIEAVGPERTAIRLSPYETYGGMTNGPETLPTYAYLLYQLELRGLANKRLAYVHTIENLVKKTAVDGSPVVLHPMDFVRFIWSGVWMRTQHYSREDAIKMTNNDDKLIIGFAKLFLANPDLVRRFKENLPVTHWNYKYFYTQTEEGYIDYPFYDEEKNKNDDDSKK